MVHPSIYLLLEFRYMPDEVNFHGTLNMNMSKKRSEIKKNRLNIGEG